MNKTTIFQTGQIRCEFEGQGLVRIIRQDNGQAIEISRTEWGFIVQVAQIAHWPTVTPEKMQEIIDGVIDTVRQCRPE